MVEPVKYQRREPIKSIRKTSSSSLVEEERRVLNEKIQEVRKKGVTFEQAEQTEQKTYEEGLAKPKRAHYEWMDPDKGVVMDTDKRQKTIDEFESEVIKPNLENKKAEKTNYWIWSTILADIVVIACIVSLILCGIGHLYLTNYSEIINSSAGFFVIIYLAIIGSGYLSYNCYKNASEEKLAQMFSCVNKELGIFYRNGLSMKTKLNSTSNQNLLTMNERKTEIERLKITSGNSLEAFNKKYSALAKSLKKYPKNWIQLNKFEKQIEEQIKELFSMQINVENDIEELFNKIRSELAANVDERTSVRSE